MTETQLAVALTALSVVIGAVISYAALRVSLRDRIPVYMMTGNRIVTGSGPIEVLVHGAQVPHVTRTLVFFWNAGRESIRSTDVVEPVRMRVKEGDLLQAAVIRSTRDEINVALEVVDQSAVVTFSHLDEKDGCCVELLHTGTDVLGVDVGAVIVGVKEGPRFLASPFWDDPVGVWIGVVVTIAGIAGAVAAIPLQAWFYLAGGILVAIFGWRMTSGSRRRDKRYLPREFRDLRIPMNPSAAGGVTGWRLKR